MAYRYLLIKNADLLVTNMSGWSANWSAENNDLSLADLLIVW